MSTKRKTLKPPVILPDGEMVGNTLRVVVGIPARELSPNGASHCHWRVRHKATKAGRAVARLKTLNLLAGRAVVPVGYSLRYYWPAMHRDDDNAIASAKATLDGICSAIGIDDRHIRFRTLEHHKDRKTPRLEVIMHLAE